MEGDALNLPFADSSFDCATIGYGLRNVVDIAQCLGELYRVLKPGAKAAILDFHQPTQTIAKLFQNWYLDHIVVPAAERRRSSLPYRLAMKKRSSRWFTIVL